MRILKKWQLFSLLIANALTISACNNSNADNNKTNDNSIVQQKVETNQQSVQTVSSKLQTELNKAKKTGKAVFVVVTGTGSTDTDKAMEVAKGANAIYKNAVIVQMDRDDATNTQLVSEWRLSGAPVPLILVISSKGFPTGGFILSQATAENLAALVPTPKMEDVYTAIGSGKAALVVFTKKALSDRKEVLKVCKEAVSIMKDNAVIVEVDMDDSQEGNFMNQLRIDKSSQVSLTLAINTKGQVSGTSKSVPDATKLATAATQEVKGGCGAGCGPAGCSK